MALVVWCVDGCSMRDQLTGDHVLTVETCGVQACVAMATNRIHLDSVIEQQPDDVDLSTG